MPHETPPPASSSNRARQATSRLNITHPVQWQDAELERTYNIDRTHRDKSAELKRLHRQGDSADTRDDDSTSASED